MELPTVIVHLALMVLINASLLAEVRRPPPRARDASGARTPARSSPPRRRLESSCPHHNHTLPCHRLLAVSIVTTAPSSPSLRRAPTTQGRARWRAPPSTTSRSTPGCCTRRAHPNPIPRHLAQHFELLHQTRASSTPTLPQHCVCSSPSPPLPLLTFTIILGCHPQLSPSPSPPPADDALQAGQAATRHAELDAAHVCQVMAFS